MLLWHEGNMFQVQVACHRLPKSLDIHHGMFRDRCFAGEFPTYKVWLTYVGVRLQDLIPGNKSHLDTLNKHHSPTIRQNFPNLPKLGVAKGEHTTYIEQSTCSNFSKWWSNLPKWPKYYQSKIRKQLKSVKLKMVLSLKWWPKKKP
jgi:hypothetical protein